MLAYELNNKIKAGLTLCGQDEDGELEWVGDEKMWKLAEELNKEYE